MNETINGIVFRLLQPSDYDSMIALWETAGLTSLRKNGRDSRESVAAQMHRDPDLVIGAFHGDFLVGISLGSYDGRKGWINRLTVHPNYQRKGIGRALLAKTENALRKRGCRIICALVEDWNQVSLDLFLKENYVLHKDIYYLSKRDNDEV